MTSNAWPISIDDVRAAERRIRPYLPPTALRRYAPLDAAVGCSIQVFVKHENHNPTNAFKARNGLAVVTALSADAKRRGVVAATRGNHGLGLAWAASLHDVPAVICVPIGNSPEKNEALRGYGAEVIEEGRDYDESVQVMRRLADERGLHIVHSTNEPLVLAGAGTLTLEILEQQPDIEAMVVSVGGGSQAVGALTVAHALRPELEIYGVQAAKASAAHDSWHAGAKLTLDSADTFADGLATRMTYDLTFPVLREGLKDFVLASEGEMAEAVRLLLRTTHNLAEGAGAASLAGLFKLRDRLSRRKVAIVLSGSNIDTATLRKILLGAL